MRRSWVIILGMVLVITALPILAQAESKKTVTIVTHGGAWGETIKEAYLIPFEKETGIKVNQQFLPQLAKIRAMVKTGNVEWDVVEASDSYRVPLERENMLEKLDYSYFDKDTLSGFEDYQKKPYAIYCLAYSVAMVYSKDAFPKGGPKSWADFWNVKKFPGARAFRAGNGGFAPIEEALLADGVSKDKLYPPDLQRAFKKLDEIRPHVVKWWVTGSEPPQLLVDKEIVLASAYSGRIADIIAKGANVEIEYNQGNLTYESFLIPKGTKNYDSAMKLVAFMSRADRQAAMSNAYPNGAVNKYAYKFISPDKAKRLPTSPENVKKQFYRDGEYWGAIDQKTGKTNAELQLEMWNSWVLKK